jgi:aminoglycoside N3'-acetyltransferase
MMAEFRSLLADIGICKSDTLFVHSSMNWIGGGVREAVALIEALLEAIGAEGTLAMPSYSAPIRPPEGSVLDLRKTPCRVGLLPEIFRRWPGVTRSASYWVPVCALGPRATEFTADQAAILNPFGPGSTFRRLSHAGARLVGLGVSLNTSSLAHLPDYDLSSISPIAVFSADPIEGEIVDFDGRHMKLRTTVVRPEVMSSYRPSSLFEHSAWLRSQLVSRQWGKALVFSYPARIYHEEGVAIGRRFLAAGRLPPWLESGAGASGQELRGRRGDIRRFN